jgi:hypothetical protein
MKYLTAFTGATLSVLANLGMLGGYATILGMALMLVGVVWILKERAVGAKGDLD